MSLRGSPLAWISSAWAQDDTEVVGLRIGDHRDQALCELLAAVVAIKAWARQWGRQPTMLRLKADSMAALGAMEKGSSKNQGMNFVMKEFMLVVAAAGDGLRLRYRHLPGARNEWADSLSRLMQPGSGAKVPGPLRAVPRTPAPARGSSWWLVKGEPEEVAEAAARGAGV